MVDVTILIAPFGFGSLGKGLAIAEELLRRRLTIKILCDTIAQRVVEFSGIPTGEYEYRKPLDLDSLRTRIVISSGDTGTPIIKGETPFVVVDSLFWLRGKWERLPSSEADMYIAQRFFVDAIEAAVSALGDRLRFVDAILPSWARVNVPKDDGRLIVVYPGGMRSPVLTWAYQESYLTWVHAVVREALLRTGEESKNLVVVLPPHLLASGPARRFAELGTVVGAGVNVLGNLLGQARYLVVTPGIETMLEASALGMTPHYLPAYNGSHIPQLMAYREAGVGDELCPSYGQELKELEAETDRLNTLTREVSRKNLGRLSLPRYKEEAVTRLADILSSREQKVPSYPLGKHGARQVADLVMPFLRNKPACRETGLITV